MAQLSLRHSFAALAFALLSACGGGSGSTPDVPAPAPTPMPTPAPALPSVQLTLSSATVSREFSSGDVIEVLVAGTWAGSNLPSASQVFLDVNVPAGGLAAPKPILVGPTSGFQAVLYTMANLPVGSRSGTIELRACKDAVCSAVYPGSAVNLPYTFKVSPSRDWAMHQRDARHSGYLPITLDAGKFSLAWQWRRAPGVEPIGGINPVVTGNNKVYVTTDVYHGEGALYALAESDGSEQWRRSLGKVPALGPPAASQGRVYAAVTGHDATALWAFEAATGNFVYKSAFSGQWPNVLAPTVDGDRVYTGAGYYGGETYSFSTDTGVRNWTHAAGGVRDMFTPAVDANFVYHYNGLALFVIDRASGATTQSISDPFGKDAEHSYHGAPMLGERKNAIAFSGGAFSGRASSNVEQYEQRVLSSFNLESRTFEWASGHSYLTAPAVAKGVIYAARNLPMSLDAIDETTGKVLWSWAPGGTEDSGFHRNIVVTDNLLFVSTDKGVVALDLATRTPVWRYPKPGMLAISAGGTLYIATGAKESDGGLVAIRLK